MRVLPLVLAATLAGCAVPATPPQVSAALFRVEGIDCEGCALRVVSILGDQPGVTSVKADPQGGRIGRVHVIYHPSVTDEAFIRRRLEKGGRGNFRVIEDPGTQ